MGNYGGYSSRAAQRQNVRYVKQAVAKAQSQSAATGRSIAAASQAALKPGTITDYTKTGVIISGKDTAIGKTTSAYYDPSGKRTTAFATSEAYQKYTPEQLSLLAKDILSPSEKEQVIKIKEMYKQERPSLLKQQPANMTRQQKEEVARIRQEQSNAKQYGTFQEYMAEKQPMSFQQPTQTFKNKEGQIKGFESPILQQSIYAGKGYYEPTTQRQIKAAERETYFRQLPITQQENILPTSNKKEMSRESIREDTFNIIGDTATLLSKQNPLLEQSYKGYKSSGFTYFTKNIALGYTQPVLYPIQSIQSTYTFFRHPIKSSKELGTSFKTQPVETTGQLFGGFLFMKSLPSVSIKFPTKISKIGYISKSVKISSEAQSVELTQSSLGFRVKPFLQKEKIVLVKGFSTTKTIPTPTENLFISKTTSRFIGSVEGKKGNIFSIKGKGVGKTQTSDTLIKSATQTKYKVQLNKGKVIRQDLISGTKSFVTQQEPLFKTTDVSEILTSRKPNAKITQFKLSTRTKGYTTELSRELIPINDNFITKSKYQSVGLGTQNKAFLKMVSNRDFKLNIDKRVQNTIKIFKQEQAQKGNVINQGQTLIQTTKSVPISSSQDFIKLATTTVRKQYPNLILSIKPSKLPLIVQTKSKTTLISIPVTKTKQTSILNTKYSLDTKQESKTQNIFKNMFQSMFSIKSLSLGQARTQYQTQTQKPDSITKTIQKQDVTPITDIFSITKPQTITQKDLKINIVPIIPVTPETTISSFDFIGGAGNKRKKKKKYNMFYIPKNKYTPSVEAIQFKVYGKQPKRAGARELSIRPMVIK